MTLIQPWRSILKAPLKQIQLIWFITNFALSAGRGSLAPQTSSAEGVVSEGSLVQASSENEFYSHHFLCLIYIEVCTNIYIIFFTILF